MSSCSLRIERLQNGWEVEFDDPEIIKKNRDPKSKGPWQDPGKSYAFQDDQKDQMITFIGSVLPKLLPEGDDDSSEFDDAFAEATKED